MDGSTVSPAAVQVCQNWVYFFFWLCLGSSSSTSCADEVFNLCSHRICFSLNLGQRGAQRIATLHGIYCTTSDLRGLIRSGLRQLGLHHCTGLSPAISMWCLR